MICPGTKVDCDNVGCRRGGCQGRMPELPLFQAIRVAPPQPAPPAPLVLLRQAEHPQPVDPIAA